MITFVQNIEYQPIVEAKMQRNPPQEHHKCPPGHNARPTSQSSAKIVANEFGWEVEDVTAYRTVRAAPPAAEIREAIKSKLTLRVVLADRSEWKVEVVGVAPEYDLAVLKVKAKSLPATPLGRSGDLLMGETVIAIGNPFGPKVLPMSPE